MYIHATSILEQGSARVQNGRVSTRGTRIMQAPPHIRARAKLNCGKYIDGEYKSVNANAEVPVLQFDGAEWEFAQTRKSMVIAA